MTFLKPQEPLRRWEASGCQICCHLLPLCWWILARTRNNYATERHYTMRATLLRNIARNALRNGTAAATARAAAQSWRRLATSSLATDAVNLDLSQAKALTCHNMMCEHVGEPCGCRIAAFLERRSFPKLETLSLRGAGLRAVPDAVLRLPLLRELDLSRNELLCALPDDLAALESLETLDVTETALETLPALLFDLPRLQPLKLRLHRRSRSQGPTPHHPVQIRISQREPRPQQVAHVRRIFCGLCSTGPERPSPRRRERWAHA